MARKTTWLGIALVAVAIIGATVFFRSSGGPSTTLRVCGWSNYFPQDLLDKFTAQTGVRVVVSYISSNEELFAKLKAGATGFDVIQPSDYMVAQLVRLKMIQPLNQQWLPHRIHLDPFFRTLAYDPDFHHSVPYAMGSTGLTIDTTKITVPPEGASWKLLFESPDLKHTSLLDDMREVFAAGLIFRGLPINTRDPQALADVQSLVRSIRNKLRVFSSEPRSLLLQGELTIAHSFSTDGLQAAKRKAGLQYFIPIEGAVLWTDNLAIPSTSERVEFAHRFIDFFLDPDNAIEIALRNQVATPNLEVKKRLPKDIVTNPGLYPDEETRRRLHLLEDLGETMLVVDRLWTELKSS